MKYTSVKNYLVYSKTPVADIDKDNHESYSGVQQFNN